MPLSLDTPAANGPSEGRGSGDEPEFVLDIDAGAILAANDAARDLWADGAAGAALPIAIDRAMPAVHRLRALSREPFCDAAEDLVFWTPRGLVRAECAVSRPRGLQPSTFVIRFPRSLPSPALDEGCGDPVAHAKLAHEIRTPLSAAVSYAEVLKDEHFGPLGSVRYRTYAANIFESARHALRLVDEMLKAYSDRSHTPRLTFTDVALDALIANCLVLARPLADRAGIELDASLPEELPCVVADELSIKQIVLNLLGNAIKFSRHGDRVSVSAGHAVNGGFHISVADNGPGMAFPPRAPGRNARGGGRGAGLGLGLPLARALAEANGASLSIESVPGRGTCATVAFAKDRVVPV